MGDDTSADEATPGEDAGPPAGADGPPRLVGGDRMAPGTAVVLVLFLLVGAVASVLRMSAGALAPQPADVALAVPDWTVTRAEAAELSTQAQARRTALPDLKSEDVEALLAAYETYNLADFKFGGPTRVAEMADAHADYEQRALAVLRQVGPEGYMALGQHVNDRFQAALDRADDDAMRRLGGTLVRHLGATRLTDARGRPSPETRPVIAIAYMVRWARVVAARQPAAGMISDTERQVLLRWKLAANPLVPPDRRLELARELQRLGSTYPLREALAARAADDGDWPRAAALYREAARVTGGDRRLEANAVYAAERARTQ